METEKLTTTAVLDLLAERGRRISASTWRAYVTRGHAPAPVARIGRTPLWDRGQVIEWHDRYRSEA